MNSPIVWNLHIDPGVLKELKGIPRQNVEHILEVIKLLPADPFFGDIQKMKGADEVWRRRIGSYRLFYTLKIRERVVLVFHVERRTSKTY